MNRLQGSTSEQREAIISRLRSVPSNYPVCHRAECPRSSECLRYQQWLLHQHEPFLMQVNPNEPSLMTNACLNLRPTLVISYALGFLKQYNRMTKEQKRQFRLLCFRKIARTNFFYQLNGTRHTTPEEQIFIRKCAQSVGYNFTPDGFDHTFTAPAW